MCNGVSCVLTDLVPLMEYSFTVAAVNANGTGPPSPALTIVIGEYLIDNEQSSDEHIFRGI